jgi:hypothetical protein
MTKIMNPQALNAGCRCNGAPGAFDLGDMAAAATRKDEPAGQLTRALPFGDLGKQLTRGRR